MASPLTDKEEKNGMRPSDTAKELSGIRTRLEEEFGMEAPERDPDGRAILHMTVRDDSDFLSPYCGRRPIISSEVADFLDNAASALPPKGDLALHIRSNVITEEEARVYDAAIRNYYRNRGKQTRRDVIRNRTAAIIMLALGVLIFALLFFLERWGLGEMMTNLLEIAAWVFIWEAVDLFFLERHRLIAAHRLCERFVGADIRFFPEEK